MKTLPYFRWYPADAETDELYASLTDAELGFFHRCLNRAWVNSGLPSDLNELARTMRVSRKYLDRIWPKVSRCFTIAENSSGKLVNRRQEEERDHAVAKSLANQRIGNANAKRTRNERDAFASQRAYESDSVSESGVNSSKGSAEGKSDEPTHPPRGPAPFVAPLHTNGKVVITAVIRSRFDEWILPWQRDPAPERSLHAFVFCWTAEDDAAMFACRDRYLASRDAADGIFQNPERFLNEQKQNHWAGKWPGRRGPEIVKTKQQEQADAWKEA